MNLKKLPLFFLLFFVAFSGTSQVNRQIPKWVNIEDIAAAGTINPKEIKDGYYFVVVDEQYNTVLKHNFFHYATKATTEAGLSNVSQIEVTYDPSYQKAFIHFIKIHRGSTIIDKTNTSDIKVLNEESQRSQGILNGDKTIYVNLSDLRTGDIVEYAYSVTGYNKIFGDHFSCDIGLSYSVPVGRISGRLIFDKATKLNIGNKNTDLQPKITEGAYNDYTWALNNPKITIVDNNTPNWYNPYPRIQLSNIANWQTAKTWFSNLFKLEPYNRSSINAIVDSIKIKCATPEERISACVDFAQNHIRYSGNENGIYSHKPHDPDYVIRNRFGDCKDKSLLLTELLGCFDVKAYPVLLNTYVGKHIESYVPSLGKFDHCIAAIEYNNQLHYIDPTISYQKGSFMNKMVPDYELGMVLDGSNTVFSTIPTDLKSRIEIVEDFTIDEATGDATLTVKSFYTGFNADNVRYYLAANSLNDVQESYRSIYLKYSDNVIVLDSASLKDDATGNSLSTLESYLLKGFWSNQKEADKSVIAKEFLPYILNEKIVYVNNVNRKDPLALKFPANITQKINILKPGGWNIDDKSMIENNDFFNYSLNCHVSNNTLHLDYSFVSKTGVVEQKDYLRYKEKADFLDKNLIFSVSQPVSGAGAKSFNWLLLVTMLVAIGISVFVCLGISKKPGISIYEKRYDSIGGWLVIVGLGIIFTPLSLTIQVIRQFVEEAGLNYYSIYFTEESSLYEPVKGYYLLIVNSLNVFLIVSSVFLAIQFLRRKASFRLNYVYFKIFNLLFLIVDLTISYYFFIDPDSLDDSKLVSKQTASIFRVFIQTCIWVPYIWVSERSRHTFTDKEEPEVVPVSTENLYQEQSASSTL